tara:strand:- start:1167 stop:2078 length:912 start_codon:yes stop_codon:yes gene_type:complete
MNVNWQGVYPAATTGFDSDENLDLQETAKHFDYLIQSGVHGLVALGTVGENTALTQHEKMMVVETAVDTSNQRVPVLIGVAENSTREAANFAASCESAGVDGLMVLPGMVYKADAKETMDHFRLVANASELPILIYNNPVAYGVDLKPEHFSQLADVETLVAIKESSEDVRRITDIYNAVGERYTIFAGVDDLALEAAMLGAKGWVAGLVNAFPTESVLLWELAMSGSWEEARQIYRWFSPLLHLDTHIKLVQYIKLTMAEVGLGSETVRAPRRPIKGEERSEIMNIIRAAIKSRPNVDRTLT